MKSYLIAIILLLSMLLITSCNQEPSLDISSLSRQEQEILLQAQEAGNTYFSQNYGVEIEYTKYTFTPASLAPTIGLNGYIKGKPEQEIFLLIDYETNEVDTASVPIELEKIDDTTK